MSGPCGSVEAPSPVLSLMQQTVVVHRAAGSCAAARLTVSLLMVMNDCERAFDEGRLRESIEIYEHSTKAPGNIELVLNVAEAQLKYYPAKSLDLLLHLHISADRLRQRVRRAVLLAEAYGITKDLASADRCLEAARKYAEELDDGDLLARVDRASVWRCLREENTARARLAHERIKGHSRFSHLSALLSEAALLQFEQRVAEQPKRLLQFLRLVDPGEPRYVPQNVYAASTLATLARDVYLPSLPDAIGEVERHLSGLAWPKDYSEDLLQTIRGLAWIKALQGDHFNAFRYLKRATEAADRSAHKVILACDRAMLAGYIGERDWSRVELARAEHLAAQVVWYDTLYEERIGLLLLAELFCGVDPVRSSIYLAQYRSLGEFRSPLFYQHDPRLRAFLKHVTGVVILASGNCSRGLADLREARAIFEQSGYEFRVAKCLMSEYRVTGNRDLLPTMEQKLRHYPQSWLANELRSLKS